MTAPLNNMTVEQLVDAISSLTVMQASELVKVLQEKLGISSAALMPAAAAAAGPAAAAVEEKTEFSVTLTKAGEKKIDVIKIVREITSLGLKEAKDLVDSAPKLLKEGLNKAEADELKKKFEAVGAVVEIK